MVNTMTANILKIGCLLNFLFLNGSVVEETTGIGFELPSELINVAQVKRAHITEMGVEMRESLHGGSLITFSEKNPHDDWSFEFTIDNPHLKFPERGGVYLWYTETVPEEGIFNGVTGKFVGMMAGIEFLGNFVNLTLTSNDGNDDFTDEIVSDVSVMRDSINPERFRNMEVFRFKIIKTWRNFKIEIYDGEKLVYDNLRYTEVSDLGDIGKGKHFSLTSTYDKVPLSKFFLLKKARLTKRTESEDYDPQKIWSPDPGNAEPRFYDSVDHPSHEIRHLISNLEHFMTYIKHFVGKSTGMSILGGLGESHREIILYGTIMDEILTILNNNKSEKTKAVIEDLLRKFDSTQDKLDMLVSNMTEFGNMIKKFQMKNRNNSDTIVLLFLLGFFITVLSVIIKRTIMKYGKFRKD